MTRPALLAVLLLLALPAGAEAHTPPWADEQAGMAVLSLGLDLSFEAGNAEVTGGPDSCRRTARRRYRCRVVVRAQPEGGPFRCRVDALVSPGRFRFPRRWATCPPGWLP